MSQLRKQMMEDMQLHGYAAKTQEAYAGAVRSLARYYHRSPAEITEEEVRAYFLWLVKERGVARSTLTLHLSGIKFLFEITLKREWFIFNLVRPPKRKKLPVILRLILIRTSFLIDKNFLFVSLSPVVIN